MSRARCVAPKTIDASGSAFVGRICQERIFWRYSLMCCGIFTLTEGRDFIKAEVVLTVGSFCSCGCGGGGGGGERGLPMLNEIIY